MPLILYNFSFIAQREHFTCHGIRGLCCFQLLWDQRWFLFAAEVQWSDVVISGEATLYNILEHPG